MEEKVTITKAANGVMKDLILEQVAPEPEPEVQTQEQQESTETQETTQDEQIQEQPKESYSQRNFKALKTEAARLAQERDEARNLIRQYEQERQRIQMQQQVPQPQPDYDSNLLENDAFAEGKHVNTLRKEIRSMKQELEQSKQEARAMTIRASLMAERPDYERVVTKENLKALELLKPHLAKAIDLNDPYNAGLACYDLIKEFNIDNQERDKTEITKALIKENLSKPKPGVSAQGTKNTTQSPLGRASEFYEGPLTDEMKKIFYKEMVDAMNGPKR